MSKHRKCDTDKYRRKASKAKIARREKHNRMTSRDREWQAKIDQRRKEHEQLAKARLEAHLRDPRTIVGQRLVNILATKLCNDPLYRLMQIGEALGIPMRQSLLNPELFVDQVKDGSIRLRF